MFSAAQSDLVNRPTRVYTHYICADTRYCLEDLPRVIGDRNGWRVCVCVRERERERESQGTPRCQRDRIMTMIIDDITHMEM